MGARNFAHSVDLFGKIDDILQVNQLLKGQEQVEHL